MQFLLTLWKAVKRGNISKTGLHTHLPPAPLNNILSDNSASSEKFGIHKLSPIVQNLDILKSNDPKNFISTYFQMNILNILATLFSFADTIKYRLLASKVNIQWRGKVSYLSSSSIKLCLCWKFECLATCLSRIPVGRFSFKINYSDSRGTSLKFLEIIFVEIMLSQ